MPNLASPANVSSQPRAVLADTSGEDKAVCAAQHGEVRPDVLAQAVAIDRVTQGGPGVARSTTPLATVLTEFGSIH